MNKTVYTIALLAGSVLLGLYAPWYTVVLFCGILSWLLRAKPALALGLSFIVPFVVWIALIYTGPYEPVAILLGELLGVSASLTPALAALTLSLPAGLVGWSGALLRTPPKRYVFGN